MKKLIKPLLILGFVALVAVAAFAYHYLSLNKAYEKRLSDYRTAYAQQITDLVFRSVSPESTADIHAFLSGETLDQMLKVLVGPRLPLSHKLALEIVALDLRVEEGAPIFSFTGRLHFQDSSSTSVEVRGAATFAPLVVEAGVFTTRLHIVALEPTLESSHTKLMLKGMIGDLVKAIGQKQLDKLPSITLPIRQEIIIPVKGAGQPISFKTRPPHSDTLHGILTVPSFELKTGLKINTAVFLADGFHLFLQEVAELPPPAEDPTWNAMGMEDRLKTLSSPDVSYFARIRLSAINGLISKVTGLPKKNRTVSFVSTGLEGHFYYWDRVQRGPFGIGVAYREEKKVYLEHADSAKAEVEVMEFKLEPRADALGGLRLKAALNGNVQLHWHYDPGPTGGVGGSVGVTIPRKEYELSASVRFVGAPTNVVEARLDGPDSIKIDVSVGLGDLGSVGLDQTVPLPKAVLFSAPMPTGLQETVRFNFGETVIQRKVTASNMAISATQDYLAVSGQLMFEEVP